MDQPRKERTLEEVIAMMRAHKLTHVKLGALEVQMDPSGFAQPEVVDPPIKQTGQPEPTEEEMMFASVGGGVPTFEDGLALLPNHFALPKE